MMVDLFLMLSQSQSAIGCEYRWKVNRWWEDEQTFNEFKYKEDEKYLQGKSLLCIFWDGRDVAIFKYR